MSLIERKIFTGRPGKELQLEQDKQRFRSEFQIYAPEIRLRNRTSA